MRKIMVIGISLLFFVGISSQATARKLHCWDLNENYACDIEAEDINNDGKCNVLDCEPVEPEEPCYAVPQTGQTTSYATGDDGDLQMGVQWPEPRFTDNGDGTVKDNLTCLIWLKNASCGGEKTWADALTFANSLYDGWTGDGSGGDCGLSDGSLPGDWHLPNIRELRSLIDYGRTGPALPFGHPFTGEESYYYWSSTTHAHPTATAYAWQVYMGFGYLNYSLKESNYFHVWPVRGGN